MAAVVVGAQDFFFTSKIREAARHAAVEVAFAASARELVDLAARPDAKLILLDLNEGAIGGPDAVRAVKADAAASRVPMVGYLSHVMVELKQAAEAAGCDRVVARSAFVKLLPGLLEEAAR